MEINYQTFRTQVFNWANQHQARFQYFWPLNGGWEHWVQAEVAAFVLTVNNAYEILREQNIYTNNQTADWALNQQTGGDERIAVELKCQRGTDPNGVTFTNDINDDVAKLRAGNLPVGVQTALVGIYYSQGAQDGIQDNYNFTMQNRRTYNNNEIGVFVFRGGIDFQ